jgi:nucleoside-diphosphate-sugar epimerase
MPRQSLAIMPASARSSVISPDAPDQASSVVMERSRQLLGRGGRVLVTGATGFIGANVVRALLHLGSEVHITVQSSSDPWRLKDVLPHVETHVASLTDADGLQRAFVGTRPAVVLHLATPRGRDEAARARILEATVTGAFHLLRLARQFDVQRLVAAGSSLEYRPSDVALTEDACTEPTTIHGTAKAAATQLYRQAAVGAGVPVCVLRFFHVYGPWESRHRLLPTAIRAALAGTPLPLTGGAIARDWVFVADVVAAVLRAAGLRRNGEVINVGSGEEYSNEAIVQCVGDTIGKPVRIVTGAFPRGPADVAHRRADRSKAARLLGWTPTATLAQGVRQTVDWFDANPAAWSADEDEHPSVV